MPVPDPARYEQVAREAAELASHLQRVESGITALAVHADRLLATTATGADKKMISVTRESARRISGAVQDLHQAAAAARKASQEAVAASEAERRRMERRG
ncbi:hypothetical protein [Raineyella fluvialis]|uniref:Excreted virulence factor EspC, type VII ESX diderm n=1 Tax=Raineyella fluvialis TaxID=2662261 RepID=A0A5Q2FD83_9ACTN|nr:hypothetical protein [Raineyella fluvialis]QGF23384.1 hypothetical protein Rai3103_06585 [Raineyella fluvialis]